jgi:serine/threonine protein kinase
MINEGSFGQVFEGFDVITDEPVAIKTEKIKQSQFLR